MLLLVRPDNFTPPADPPLLTFESDVVPQHLFVDAEHHVMATDVSTLCNTVSVILCSLWWESPPAVFTASPSAPSSTPFIWITPGCVGVFWCSHFSFPPVPRAVGGMGEGGDVLQCFIMFYCWQPHTTLYWLNSVKWVCVFASWRIGGVMNESYRKSG